MLQRTGHSPPALSWLTCPLLSIPNISAARLFTCHHHSLGQGLGVTTSHLKRSVTEIPLPPPALLRGSTGQQPNSTDRSDLQRPCKRKPETAGKTLWPRAVERRSHPYPGLTFVPWLLPWASGVLFWASRPRPRPRRRGLAGLLTQLVSKERNLSFQ